LAIEVPFLCSKALNYTNGRVVWQSAVYSDDDIMEAFYLEVVKLCVMILRAADPLVTSVRETACIAALLLIGGRTLYAHSFTLSPELCP
jgi:hypothetical protein